MTRVTNFLFEVGMLKRIPRSGWAFLPGAEGESVADHVFRTAVIAWTLARLDPSINTDRVIELALFHDLPEARTGDLNYVHQKYVEVDEAAAARHQTEDLPFGAELEDLISEYREGVTPESVVAHDADQLEMLLSLKERLDGGAAAETWQGRFSNHTPMTGGSTGIPTGGFAGGRTVSGAVSTPLSALTLAACAPRTAASPQNTILGFS